TVCFGQCSRRSPRPETEESPPHQNGSFHSVAAQDCLVRLLSEDQSSAVALGRQLRIAGKATLLPSSVFGASAIVRRLAYISSPRIRAACRGHDRRQFEDEV